MNFPLFEHIKTFCENTLGSKSQWDNFMKPANFMTKKAHLAMKKAQINYLANLRNYFGNYKRTAVGRLLKTGWIRLSRTSLVCQELQPH